MKYKIFTTQKRLLADTLTPINIYLKLRDVFAGSILLESSDYHGHENSLSLICCKPIASFQVKDDQIAIRYPDKKEKKLKIKFHQQVLEELDFFRKSFDIEQESQNLPCAGIFGYMSYDAVKYFEQIEIKKQESEIPDILYKFYKYVIAVDHFSNEMTLFENHFDSKQDSELKQLEQIIYNRPISLYPFSAGDEESSITDEDYKDLVAKGISHCKLGDVFQIVLSRKFSYTFKGDEFNVYRTLRSINPSPYLFYFDFGNFKLFGSSPETQIKIIDSVASLYPIAGTIKRSGSDSEDEKQARILYNDEKENSEHVMLVDLARNDLSRASTHVNLEVFKEIQFYSHLIHLVSKVTGKLKEGISPLKLVADTFPAGTLSGAPKHEAMKLIDKYELTNRGFYGGAIGFIGFHGDFNHAIMIRTFLSKNNRLISQAGAGIVAKSIPENELAEANHKLGALRKAIKLAKEL